MVGTDGGGDGSSGGGGWEKTAEAVGTVSRRHRSLNTPASALLKEKEVDVASPGRRVPLACCRGQAQRTVVIEGEVERAAVGQKGGVIGRIEYSRRETGSRWFQSGRYDSFFRPPTTIVYAHSTLARP